MNTAGNALLSEDWALPNRLPSNGTIRVKRRLNSAEVIDALTDLFILRGIPAFIRSEVPIEGAIGSSPMGDGPEFIAQAVRDWIAAVGAQPSYIEPRSPWENEYCESFNARFRDELLNWTSTQSMTSF